MVRANRHIAIRKNRMPPTLPDLALLEGVVAPRILDAMKAAAAQLAKLKIPFALAGGLAVGAYGYPRATKDVDFLVGDEAFETHEGGIVTISPGVPIQVGDVPVDSLSIRTDEKHLAKSLKDASSKGPIPILPLPALVYLKLKSPRRKDSADIVELLRVASDPGSVRAYIAKNAPELLEKYDGLAKEAEE
jgi:hypothetical protein